MRSKQSRACVKSADTKFGNDQIFDMGNVDKSNSVRLNRSIHIILVTVWFGLVNCYSQGAVFLDVQNNNGNTELTLTAPITLQWANTDPAFNVYGWSGFGNSHADGLWQGPTSQAITENLANFATVTDISSGQSANISQLTIFFDPGGFGTVFYFGFDSIIHMQIGDSLQISPASATVTIPLSVTDFVAGSVTIPANSASFPNSLFNAPFTMVVEPTPEPSTTELLGIAFALSVCKRRICRLTNREAV
jgi:hypothetical protein